MDYNESLFFKIEQYLKNKLSEKDKSSFETEMEKDNSLKEMVKLQRLERQGQELLIEEDLLSKMAIWEQEVDKVKTDKGFQWRKWLPILLPLILLPIVLFSYLRSTQKGLPNKPTLIEKEIPVVIPSSNDKQPQIEEKSLTPAKEPTKTNNQSNDKSPLIANQDKPKKENLSPTNNIPINNNQYVALTKRNDLYRYPVTITSTLKSNDSQTTTSILDKGIEAFIAQSFPTAIQIFKNIEETEHPETYEIAQEWLAHAYYQEGLYKNAAQIFSTIAATSTMNAKDRAEWYLTLSLLANYSKNQQQINDLLSKMIEENNYHDFQEMAKKLKREIAEIQ